MTFLCPHCGGAIDAIPSAQLAQSSGATGAISTQNGKIAQEILTQDLAVTKDGRQPYNRGYPEEFELFWKVYPMRRDKRKALLAWRKSVRRLAQSSGANLVDAMAQILAGATRYRDDPNRDAQFTKYAEGWLNGDRWEDEPLPTRSVPGVRQDPPRPMTSGEMRDYILERSDDDG